MMFKKSIVLFIVMLQSGLLLAEATTEEMIVDYQLTTKQTELSNEELYQIGINLYNKPGKVVVRNNHEYRTYENRRDAMRFFIPAGRNGHYMAGVYALEYLSKNAISPTMKRDKLEISMAMNEAKFPFGAYMLASCYHYGVGVGRNLDHAQVLYEKVHNICVTNYKGATQFLNPLKIKGKGELRCKMATNQFNMLRSAPRSRYKFDSVVDTSHVKEIENRFNAKSN